ncbi:MAG: DUF2809 domain-containing protein [Oscillospiraceae bacterium]|nr:DUF2809 domain-containing protein [Oscillospiraceae bacterium]
MNKRLYYAILSAVLLGVECCIGAFAHGWIRGYFGDVLVMPLLFCLVRVLFPKALPRTMPLLICGVGFVAEITQYFRLYEVLGFEKGSLGAVILGTDFSWNDLLCYMAGTVLIYLGTAIENAVSKTVTVKM